MIATEETSVPSSIRILSALFVAAALLLIQARISSAAETTIKLGNTAPYSGPASAYGTIARAEAAYFQMLNDHGGKTDATSSFWPWTMPTRRPRRSSRPAS